MDIRPIKLNVSYELANSRRHLDIYDTYYCITIKHMNAKVIDYKEDLDKFIDKHYRGVVEIIFVAYEEDSKHKLHAHILAKGLSWDIKFKGIRYWSTFIRADKTYEKWLSYCKKYARNHDEQEQILLRHFSYHNNMFET